MVWLQPTVEVRIDNEWRKQETNALRNGDDSAFFSHALTYSPAQIEGLSLVLAVDNLWDERFEEIPERRAVAINILPLLPIFGKDGAMTVNSPHTWTILLDDGR